MVSSHKEQEKKKFTEIKTFPVPIGLGEIKGNITLTSHTSSRSYKEQKINQAIQFQIKGNIPEAEKLYQYLIQQGFKDERIFSNYGDILRDLGKLEEAELSYRKAIEIKPDLADAYLHLGSILIYLDNLKEAEVFTRKAIEIKPDLADAYLNLGSILIYLDNLKEAEVFTRKAIEIKPDLADAYVNLGSILIYLDNLKEAEVFTRKAIEIKPDYAEAHCNLGNILKDLDYLKDAVISYQKAIEIKPDYAEAHCNLGNILKDLDYSENAELSTRKAIALNPNFAEAHLNLGSILSNLGKFKDAELSTRKAIELKPDYADAYYNLATILIEIGNLNQAKICIRKSIKLNPNFAQAYQVLSNIYSLENDFTQACKEIERAIKLDPNNHLFKGELTRIKFIQGEYDEKTTKNNQLWSDQDDYLYEDNNTDILLVIFGSMGRDSKLIPSFNFYNLFKNNKSFDKLFLRDIDRNYYLTGLKNSTNNLQETVDLIRKMSSIKKYKKTISVGASAGGFAAILFGHLLKFSKVIVFNPQTVISKEKETLVKDNFYTVELCEKLRNLHSSDTLYQKCLNLKNLIPFKTKVEIHYSNLSKIDKNHAKFVEHENCKLIKHNSSSHLLALQLRDSEDLEDIIVKSLTI